MQQDHISLLEQWLANESFHHWAKQSNRDDHKYWEVWLAQHPENKELAEIAAQIIRGVRFQEIAISQQKSAKALEQVLQKVGGDVKPSYPLPQPAITFRSKTAFLHNYRLQIAASVALLVFAGIFMFYQITAGSYIVVKTNFGEKKEMLLPDHTKVVLNANSALRYDEENPRKVWLTGEAFFEVKKKPETNEQFLVLTNDLTVEVLGTVFNVNSRDEQTKVFLEEGKVKLNLKDEGNSDVMLSPGDLLTFSVLEKRHYEKKQSETALHTSWKDGVLFLKDTPLQEVITQMEDLYGISITLQNDTLRQRKMTLALPIERLEIALVTLENTLGVPIERKDEGNYRIE